MHISVAHSTVYRYSNPVFLEPHVFRLRPREDASQRLRQFLLNLSPAPAGHTDCEDQDGNAITRAWFEGLTSELAVTASFQVETLRENPFDYLLLERDKSLPMQYAAPLRAPLAPHLHVEDEPAVREWAQQLAAEAGWQALPLLARLNQSLFERTNQVIRHEGAALPAARTLADREGSCRDVAVLFCAACRSLGLAARFVSGYERDASLLEAGDMHAWAEVYLEGGGWRGYDPSRGLAVAATHVPVAASADSSLAAPVTGSYRGDAVSTIEYQIAMQAT